MSTNDNEHPAIRIAAALLDAEIDRILAACRSGEIMPEERNKALERLASATFSLPPNASAEDMKRMLGAQATPRPAPEIPESG